MHKVLILDGNQRSALAATRSLGKRCVPLIVADQSTNTLAGSSKYCPETMVYPSPSLNSEMFIETLKKESLEKGVTIIFPMSELTTYLVLRHREEFSKLNIPFAPFETFEALSNKWELYKLAKQLNIPTPITQYVSSHDYLGVAIEKLKFPVVLKPYRSGIISNGEWIAPPVKHLPSMQEIKKAIACDDSFKNQPFLIQEYIEGQGQGIFALYNQGRPIAFFAHRRLREKPPSGGVSVLSESVKINPYMLEISQKILNHVGWHGVAMVEFKVALDGTPYLIEVNARFWGSLQLAINAGVNFPWLLYQLAIGANVNTVSDYTVGVRNRWLLGDLDHLYLRLVNQCSFSEKWQAIGRFLEFLEPNTKFEVNRWDDFRPFLFELKRYSKELKG